MSSARPSYIVAIGSSAGGLEALTAFLNYLPNISNLAVIVAQHLSSTHKSHLIPLLARETSWPVVEIASGLCLEACHVYITPPDSEATLNSGHFALHPPASAIGPKPSASLLFASVAAQEGSLPIAVVLSGTGTDGAEGLSSVKEAGGWCFAHTPDHARYNGMPQAAINTGYVDYVLEPAKMGEKIQDLIDHPELITPKKAENLQRVQELHGAPVDAYLQIIALLTEHTGTHFLNYKTSTIHRRLQKRLEALQYSSYEEYLQGLQSDPAEIDRLFKTMLINVTRFFRNPEVFEAFKVHLLHLLQQKKNGQSLRIWVPGCASGEEAYTLAMLVQTLLLQEALQLEVQIFATDISESSLSVARRGIYPEESLQDISDEWRQQYFISLTDGQYEIKKSIRNLVLFSHHDLTNNPPFLKLDLISCRNLLIYFDAHLQKYIIPLFHFSLNPDGLLLLGKSETIGTFDVFFDSLNERLKIFRRRSALTTPDRLPLHTFNPVLSSRHVPMPMRVKEESSLQSSVQVSLFENYPSPYVVVNSALDLLQIHGDVSEYLSLSAGRMSTHLLKLCHAALQMEIRSLSSQCMKENRAIIGSFRRWPTPESKLLLRLLIQPVRPDKAHNECLLLVIFERLDLEAQFIPLLPQGTFSQREERLYELEHELDLTQEYLQTIVEELGASNEELQVLNEELQSANEELQSTNEELETTNEELQSTNEEMQVAYTELRTANDVLESKDLILEQSQIHMRAILENNSQGFVLIGPDYCLMAFNQLAQQQHQLHFSAPLKEGMWVMDAFDTDTLTQLLPLMQQVFKQRMKTQQNFYFESVESGYWYSYLLMPVLKNHQVTGLTLSMQDITEKMSAYQALEASNALIDSVFDATSTGICVTDAKGFFTKVNQGYCDIYGYTAQQLLGQHFTVVVFAEQKQIASDMHDAFIAGKDELCGEWQVQAKDGRFIDIFSSARLLINPDGSRCKVTTVNDISENKKYRDLLKDTQEALGVGGWELDVISNAIYWTPEVYAIYGLPSDTFIDLEMSLSRYPQEARVYLEQALQTAISVGTAFDIELQFYCTDKALIWVRVTCKPIRVYEKTVKLFGTIQDITAQKLAEEDKSQLISELTYKNEDLKQFTYIISHNLRAPVANLLGLVNVLELKAADTSDVLKHIKTSATQLDEVIQDLNQILSVRRQDQQDFHQQVDLEAEIRALMLSLEPELKDLNAQITFDFKENHVFTTRSYIHSILYNLLTNAIKYASEQRALEIHVCSWQENEFTYLSVQDNGRGFDPEKVSGQMFRLYKRFHPQIPGKGMGLYLVKTQAEALGGGVTVVSQEEQGACFTIYVKSNPV